MLVLALRAKKYARSTRTLYLLRHRPSPRSKDHVTSQFSHQMNPAYQCRGIPAVLALRRFHTNLSRPFRLPAFIPLEPVRIICPHPNLHSAHPFYPSNAQVPLIVHPLDPILLVRRLFIPTLQICPSSYHCTPTRLSTVCRVSPQLARS